MKPLPSLDAAKARHGASSTRDYLRSKQMTEVNVEGLNAVETALRERIVESQEFRTAQHHRGRHCVPPVAPSIDDVLAQRIRRAWRTSSDDAATAQALKYVMHDGKNRDDLSSIQREALDNIATKIARILSGDPNIRHHWFDIVGY